ncbi:retrovirus-related pol polyprotein from transposon TNT 1-94 [Tanacetum coccineum]
MLVDKTNPMDLPQLGKLSTSKLHAMGNVSSISTSQTIASNVRMIALTTGTQNIGPNAPKAPSPSYKAYNEVEVLERKAIGVESRKKAEGSSRLERMMMVPLCGIGRICPSKILKQAYASHKAKNVVSMTKCLELLHMDLFGPSAVQSYGGNRYTLVIVDDYSRIYFGSDS